jgi:hypothetical protein
MVAQARSFQKLEKDHNYVAGICVPKMPSISGPSSLVKFDNNNHCAIWIQNCAPYEVQIRTGDKLGIVEAEDQIYERLPRIKKKTWTRKEIKERCHLGAPEEYQARYINSLFRHQAAISLNKYDLGLAKDSGST